MRVGLAAMMCAFAGAALAQGGPVDNRPHQSRFVDERPQGPQKPLPAGRGQAPVARGTGGPGDVGRAEARYGAFAPDPYATPSYGVAPDAPRQQTFDLTPGAGPRQGYYENPQGYYATPDFSAPEPRVE